jgi:lysozyme family protein
MVEPFDDITLELPTARMRYDNRTIDRLAAHLALHKDGEGRFAEFASEWYARIAESVTPQEAWENTLACLNAGTAMVNEVTEQANAAVEEIATAVEQTIANMTAVWEALSIGDEEE